MFEKWSETDVFCTFLLQNVRFATAACIFSTSELQKVLSDPQFFYMFTCKCAFRHSGVQFFDIWTSKSALGPSVFLHFHLQMCFSPQRRAIFRHLNFKKCSRNAVFCTFSLPNVLFATAACNFSTSELQKVLRGPQFFNILTSKCAFRHSGVQFLISPLSSYLRTRRFNRPTFGLTRHTNHWKNTAFRDFSNIWRGCIFFLLTFALLHLLSADLTTLLCFSTVHIVGSFYLNFLRLQKDSDKVDVILFCAQNTSLAFRNVKSTMTILLVRDSLRRGLKISSCPEAPWTAVPHRGCCWTFARRSWSRHAPMAAAQMILTIELGCEQSPPLGSENISYQTSKRFQPQEHWFYRNFRIPNMPNI